MEVPDILIGDVQKFLGSIETCVRGLNFRSRSLPKETGPIAKRNLGRLPLALDATKLVPGLLEVRRKP
jgi:hypothetical protein